MGLVTGMDIGDELAKALDMPENTRRIEITIDAEEIVEVKCWYAPDEQELDRLKLLLQNYQLARQGEPEEVMNEPTRDLVPDSLKEVSLRNPAGLKRLLLSKLGFSQAV